MTQWIFWSLIGAAIMMAVAAFTRLAQNQETTIFDYLVLPLPFVFWWVLAAVGWKSKSLSNLIEPLILVGIVPLLFLGRAYIGFIGTSYVRSIAALSASLLLAGLLYALIPALPE